MVKLTDLDELNERQRAKWDAHYAKVRTIVDGLPSWGCKATSRRARLHMVLDALLDLQDVGANDPSAAQWYLPIDADPKSAAHEARSLAASLIGEIAEWMNLPADRESKIVHRLPEGLFMWRQAMAFHLNHGVHALPRASARHLANALLALDDGTGKAPPSLLPAQKHTRQGPHPLEARRCELKLLEYIEYRNARGEKKGQVQAEVAGAIGLIDVDGVRKWKAAAIKTFNREHVEGCLKGARDLALAGQPFSDDPDPLSVLAKKRNAAARTD